jgi:hypothetical protein
MVFFHLVCVNDQIAFKDVAAPVRFFTPFPRQSSRPCGTPHVYLLSRPDISQPCSAPPDVLCRAHTVLGPDSVGFPRRKHRCGEAMFGGIQGGMPPWSQDRSEGPVREGEAGSRKRSEANVGRGKAELFPLQRDSGRLNLPMSLHPSLNAILSYLSRVLLVQNRREPLR